MYVHTHLWSYNWLVVNDIKPSRLVLRVASCTSSSLSPTFKHILDPTDISLETSLTPNSIYLSWSRSQLFLGSPSTVTLTPQYGCKFFTLNFPGSSHCSFSPLTGHRQTQRLWPRWPPWSTASAPRETAGCFPGGTPWGPRGTTPSSRTGRTRRSRDSWRWREFQMYWRLFPEELQLWHRLL